MKLQLKTVKEFLAEKPDLTVCGLAWSVAWRFMVMYMASWVALVTLAFFIGALSGLA